MVQNYLFKLRVTLKKTFDLTEFQLHLFTFFLRSFCTLSPPDRLILLECRMHPIPINCLLIHTLYHSVSSAANPKSKGEVCVPVICTTTRGAAAEEAPPHVEFCRRQEPISRTRRIRHSLNHQISHQALWIISRHRTGIQLATFPLV